MKHLKYAMFSVWQVCLKGPQYYHKKAQNTFWSLASTLFCQGTATGLLSHSQERHYHKMEGHLFLMKLQNPFPSSRGIITRTFCTHRSPEWHDDIIRMCCGGHMCTAATTEEIADVCGPTSNLPTEGMVKLSPLGCSLRIVLSLSLAGQVPDSQRAAAAPVPVGLVTGVPLYSHNLSSEGATETHSWWGNFAWPAPDLEFVVNLCPLSILHFWLTHSCAT